MTQPSCEERVKACLARIDANPHAASLALTHLDPDGALRHARTLDQMLDAAPGTLAGEVCSVKACFEVAGWVTHAGSRALTNAAPARKDAAAVARLRAQGAVVLAQTNMTEFAYGALGVNHRFGTPISPLYENEHRVAGGSSSGAAVSVAMGFSDFSLCSDTSGSARIPAAFCGVVGYAPTRGTIPTSGMIGLSFSFDVPGIMAPSVMECGRAMSALLAKTWQGLESGTPSCSVLVPDTAHTIAEPDVAIAFQAAIDYLAARGVRIVTKPLSLFFEAGRLAAEGGIIAADAFSLHEQWLVDRGTDYDPLVKRRIEAGAQVLAYRYTRAQHRLNALSDLYEEELGEFDALLTPTCPMIPPVPADLSDQSVYLRTNKHSFVFTEIANRLNKPSISLPLKLPATRPVGILLTGRRNGDDALLGLAAQIEHLLNDNL